MEVIYSVVTVLRTMIVVVEREVLVVTIWKLLWYWVDQGLRRDQVY